MCIANIFHWLQLSNHLFLTDIDLLIFLITGKIASSMPPKTKYLINKCCPLHKVNCNLSDSITQEQYYKIYWVSIFSCIPIVLQSKNHTGEKPLTAMVKNYHQIQSKRTNEALWFLWFGCYTIPFIYHDKVFWPSHGPATSYFQENTHFTWTCVMHKSSILHKPGRKAWQF